MATVTEVLEPQQAVVDEARPRPYRISVDEYDRMVDAGVFEDRRPIYLWKGQLVESMPKGPAHGFSVTAVRDVLPRLVPEGFFVRQENPTRILDDSKPEPDLTVIRGSNRDYSRRHPNAGDVVLAIEVADSSRTFDRGEKLEGYAASSIPVYWVVDLRESCVEVYTAPTGPTKAPGYSEHSRFGIDDEVPVILDGVEVGRIAVKDVLP